MLLIDTHMHSTVSFDGEASRLAMAEASRAAGLDVICFTDHYDIYDENNALVPHYDWAPARAQRAEARRRFPEGAGLKLLYGLELGNAPGTFPSAEEALREPGLDCVIGSIHNGSGAMNHQDYFYIDYRGNPTLARACLEDYFRQEAELTDWGNFDTLGHLPYPLRYIRERDGLLFTLADFRPLYLDTLRLWAEKGGAVEVNTNRARDDLSDYRTLLQDWKRVGGRLVTVGADAHRTEDVGKGIRNAYALLLECGFPCVTYFEGRRPVEVAIDRN